MIRHLGRGTRNIAVALSAWGMVTLLRLVPFVLGFSAVTTAVFGLATPYACFASCSCPTQGGFARKQDDATVSHRTHTTASLVAARRSCAGRRVHERTFAVAATNRAERGGGAPSVARTALLTAPQGGGGRDGCEEARTPRLTCDAGRRDRSRDVARDACDGGLTTRGSATSDTNRGRRVGSTSLGSSARSATDGLAKGRFSIR